jgi:integrase
VREEMIRPKQGRDPKTGAVREWPGWCRKVANRNVSRLKQVFKWAVGAELLPEEVWRRLLALEGLRKGRSQARETEKVRPVPDAQVDAVLPLLSPQVVAMIELQRLTGARSGELCTMRTCDVDTADKRVWVYRPPKHKTSHHDQVREILLGPKAREILEPFLKPDLQAYVFSPAEAAEWHRQRRRKQPAAAGATAPVSPAEQLPRQPGARSRRPGAKYTKGSYAEAIERACDIAFPPPPELARQRAPARGRKARRSTRQETLAEWRARLGPERWAELLKWQKRHRWHPHQLRHSFATRVRRDFGREVVGAMLGDRSPAMVDVYAERDQEAARRVAAQIG